jgi:hypothetical protein
MGDNIDASSMVIGLEMEISLFSSGAIREME